MERRKSVHQEDRLHRCEGGARTVAVRHIVDPSLTRNDIPWLKRESYRGCLQPEELVMPFSLPPLPYDYTALEPHIDEQTMRIHHDKHHNTYVTNLNTAIQGNAELEALSAEELIKNLAKVPADKQTAVRNNGGG